MERTVPPLHSKRTLVGTFSDAGRATGFFGAAAFDEAADWPAGETSWYYCRVGSTGPSLSTGLKRSR